MQRFLVLESQLQSFSPTVHCGFVNTRSSLLSKPEGGITHVQGTVRSKMQAPQRHRHYCWFARLHKQEEQWPGGYLLSPCSRADTNQDILWTSQWFLLGVQWRAFEMTSQMSKPVCTCARTTALALVNSTSSLVAACTHKSILTSYCCFLFHVLE